MDCVLKEECNIPRRPWSLEVPKVLLNCGGGILSWLAYGHALLISASRGDVLIAWENLALNGTRKAQFRKGGGGRRGSEREEERLNLLKGWRKRNKIPLTVKFRYLLNWTTWAHKQGADNRQRKKERIHSGLGLEPGAFQMWRIIYT